MGCEIGYVIAWVFSMNTLHKKVTLFPTYISTCISSFWQIRINYVYLFQYRFVHKIFFYRFRFDFLWNMVDRVVILLIKKRTLYYKNYIFNNAKGTYFYILITDLNKSKINFLRKFLDSLLVTIFITRYFFIFNIRYFSRFWII